MKLRIVLAPLTFALMLGSACGDDTDSPPGGIKLDGKGGNKDAGTNPSGDLSSGNKDSGTPKDSAGASTFTCLEIISCVNNCPSGDQACANACAAKGSADAQTKFNALLACTQTVSYTHLTLPTIYPV